MYDGCEVLVYFGCMIFDLVLFDYDMLYVSGMVVLKCLCEKLVILVIVVFGMVLL